MTVVVKNDRIERVVDGLLDAAAIDAPAGSSVEIVDLSDRFVLPGLMDAHVHLRGEPSRGSRRRERGDRPEPTAAQMAVNAMIFARRNLAAGFTSLRDVGSNDESVFAVRDAIDAGRMIGPRILVSGSAVAVTGGHGDATRMELSGDPAARLADGTCDGPVECRRAVRYLYKLGADLIKFTSTGGFGSNTGLDPQLFEDEMRAIVDTAHLLGMKATTHAYSAVAIKDAIRAGVDSIEHGFLLDDEAIRLMKKNGVFLVPTISASYPPPIFNIPDPPSVEAAQRISRLRTRVRGRRQDRVRHRRRHLQARHEREGIRDDGRLRHVGDGRDSLRRPSRPRSCSASTRRRHARTRQARGPDSRAGRPARGHLRAAKNRLS